MNKKEQQDRNSHLFINQSNKIMFDSTKNTIKLGISNVEDDFSVIAIHIPNYGYIGEEPAMIDQWIPMRIDLTETSVIKELMDAAGLANSSGVIWSVEDIKDRVAEGEASQELLNKALESAIRYTQEGIDTFLQMNE